MEQVGGYDKFYDKIKTAFNGDDSLAKKNLITRELTIKNNRPVKMVKITDDGIRKINEVAEKVRPRYSVVREQIKNRNLAKVGDLLKELRDILKETVEIQI